MYNYIEQLRKAIKILEDTSRAQSTLALKVYFSMGIYDLNEVPDELRQTTIAFLNETGFRMTKWTNDGYKNKPGGAWNLRLAGGAEFTVYDGRMIGNEQ